MNNADNARPSPKFIFVTGGVVSSLGKGIAAASIGALLEARGFSVSVVKADPYINVDPGNMSPFEHGEVFVTEDGAETDLDLGHYERFLQNHCTAKNSFSAGMVYDAVITRERQGDYLGETIQVIPHITNEIKARMMAGRQGRDICIVEVGGTTGDIEALPFQEAIRQMSLDLGRKHCLFLHLTLLPYVRAAGELKTKPTQHSVKELLSIGIQPDILMCRSEHAVSEDVRAKISQFTNVAREAVLVAEDVDSIYRVPLQLARQQADVLVLEHFGLPAGNVNLARWQGIEARMDARRGTVRIGVVGKYFSVSDAYKSIHEALFHAGLHHGVHVETVAVDAENTDMTEVLANMDAVLIPGGFGNRGVAGKIAAVKVARTAKLPFLGICLGMQVAVIEYARHVAGLAGAVSTEWLADANADERNAAIPDEHPIPVISLVDEWVDETGRTHRQNVARPIAEKMRLGNQKATIKQGTLAAAAFGATTICERHRHRYEVNSAYVDALVEHGLIISATCTLGGDALVEMIELPETAHPWFVACQYHPELSSKPGAAHPLFVGLVAAALAQRQQ